VLPRSVWCVGFSSISTSSHRCSGCRTQVDTPI